MSNPHQRRQRIIDIVVALAALVAAAAVFLLLAQISEGHRWNPVAEHSTDD